jgi:uncharacterized protein YjdB
MKMLPAALAVRVLAVLVALLPLLNCGTNTGLQKITVTPANPSVAKGQTVQLVATGSYSDGSQQNLTDSVTWQTSKPTIAGIGDQGQVTGMDEGASQVSATYQGITGSTYVTIGAPALIGISVSPTQSSLPLGESEQLTATGNFSDGTTQNLTQSAAWSSSGTGIASVGPTGSVLAAGLGAATITASSGSINGSASINVAQAVLLSITVSPGSVTLPVGGSQQLTAMGKFSDGSTQDLTQSAVWASSVTGTANVTRTGSVLAAAPGTVNITATSGSISGAASVTVGQAALLGITVSPNLSSVPVGESEQLTATGNFSDGSTLNLTQSVTWASSGTGVASVAPSGSVLGNALGTATITATSGSIVGSASVTVGQAALVGITVSPAQSSLPVGETQQLTATGNFSDGSTQNLTQSVTWSSSSSTIASVGSSGSVVANALGSATVTASSSSLTGSAGVSVTPAVVVSLNIVPATVSMVLQGSTQLQAQATWSDGTSQNVTASASWSATPDGIVSLNSSGMATASQVGTTTVFATYSGATGTANASVMPLMMVSYYSLINSKAAGIDGTLYITNPGLTIASPNLGNLCAMIYVFDQNQELNECCGCPVSDSGLLTLSLDNDLTANTLTGISPNAGEIILIPSDITPNPQCNAGSLAPTGALSAWETHVQNDPLNTVTEAAYDSIALSSANQALLPALCTALQELGSGAGTCTCGPGEGAAAVRSSRKR